jgi:glycerate kinase
MSITQFQMVNAETKYVEVPVVDGAIGFQLAWMDAVSSATVTLELTSFRRIAATVAGSAWEWKDSGVTITGPAASAAGSVLVNVENVRQRRGRVKIVAAAACSFDLQEALAA